MRSKKMTTSKFGFGSIIAAVVLSAAATQTNAQTYNPTTDFSSSSNPTGVWSYGYSPVVGPPSYSFTLFNTETGGAGAVDLWTSSTHNSLDTPSVALNNLGSSE